MMAPDPGVRSPVQFETVPDRLRTGGTLLVADTTNPADDAVCLQLLSQYSSAADTALVVTTTHGAAQTDETSEHLSSATDQPTLGIVDTVSNDQSVVSFAGDLPVVFTPTAGDLERLVVGLSQLTEQTDSTGGTRHLVVRSLTPVLRTAPTTRVCTVLERITGLQSGTGLSLLGIDYTAHDQETMAAVAEQVEGILWITRSNSGGLACEYDATPGRAHYPRGGGET